MSMELGFVDVYVQPGNIDVYLQSDNINFYESKSVVSVCVQCDHDTY